MPRYKYSRKPPSTTHLEMDYPNPLGHNYGLVRRRDILTPTPKGRLEKKIYCSCGWDSREWTQATNRLKVLWYGHVQEVEKQLVLFKEGEL